MWQKEEKKSGQRIAGMDGMSSFSAMHLRDLIYFKIYYFVRFSSSETSHAPSRFVAFLTFRRPCRVSTNLPLFLSPLLCFLFFVCVSIPQRNNPWWTCSHVSLGPQNDPKNLIYFPSRSWPLGLRRLAFLGVAWRGLVRLWTLLFFDFWRWQYCSFVIVYFTQYRPDLISFIPVLPLPPAEVARLNFASFVRSIFAAVPSILHLSQPRAGEKCCFPVFISLK